MYSYVISSVGKDEKHTREGYKTGHKRKAFAQLEVIASDMNIHMQVVQKAKEEWVIGISAAVAVVVFGLSSVCWWYLLIENLFTLKYLLKDPC